MDSISASGVTTTGETLTVNGIEFGLRGTLQTPAGQATVGNQFYVPNQVARDTTFTYKAGKPIYKLTDPDGNVYIMQSYAQIVDKSLTYKQLRSLGKRPRMQLPTGWKYSSEKPKQDLQLVATGVAYVVNDALANSYQRR